MTFDHKNVQVEEVKTVNKSIIIRNRINKKKISRKRNQTKLSSLSPLDLTKPKKVSHKRRDDQLYESEDQKIEKKNNSILSSSSSSTIKPLTFVSSVLLNLKSCNKSKLKHKSILNRIQSIF
jgi:hypothetical protein